jgi:hypothetical protein
MTTLVECNDPILGHQFKVLTKGVKLYYYNVIN